MTTRPEQGDLFASKGGARASDPGTSHEAAAAAEVSFSTNVLQTLYLYRGYGVTDEQAWRLTERFYGEQWPIGTVSKRRYRCVDRGLIEQVFENDRPVTRKTRQGVNALVWRLTDQGREALRTYEQD